MRFPLLPAALLLAAGCASGGGYDDPAPSRGEDAAAAPRGDNAPGSVAASGPGIRAGWLDPRSESRSAGLASLTLVSQSSREGRLIASGKAQMPGGKVIDDRMARDMVASFEQSGFDRFAVAAHPDDAPSNALGVIWLDAGDGRGIRSLFLLPGAVNDPRTRDLPKAYEALKHLIISINQVTPGSMVITGEGWSGDDMMNQRPRGR